MGKTRYYGPNVPGSDSQITRALYDFSAWMDRDFRRRPGIIPGGQDCMRREVSERKPATFFVTHTKDGKIAPMVHADVFQCKTSDKDPRLVGLWYQENWGGNNTRDLRLGIICTASSGLLVLKGDYNDKFDTDGRQNNSGKGANEFHWERPADSTREVINYLEVMRKIVNGKQDLTQFVEDWAGKSRVYPWHSAGI